MDLITACVLRLTVSSEARGEPLVALRARGCIYTANLAIGIPLLSFLSQASSNSRIMPFENYQRQTHRTSTRYRKYSTDHYGLPHDLHVSPSPRNVFKSIRNGLCRILGISRLKHHQNASVDSLAYAGSDDSFEAESMDEENMAWGRPPKRSKRSKRRSQHMDKESIENQDPQSPDTALCRLWI
ncbi:hypothetical protein DFH11DRAFT_611554 [Phellopilus nigrolimitatus]|nr:hypothetical protein DFH11DRAFT_611554 [Phellopilus nigrolimitatus]